MHIVQNYQISILVQISAIKVRQRRKIAVLLAVAGKRPRCVSLYTFIRVASIEVSNLHSCF
jgi:hypothetical protein